MHEFYLLLDCLCNAPFGVPDVSESNLSTYVYSSSICERKLSNDTVMWCILAIYAEILMSCSCSILRIYSVHVYNLLTCDAARHLQKRDVARSDFR